jgi:hypothetical protein
MPDLTDDEITARAIEQALQYGPEPTHEQAHDAVAAQIAMLAGSYWCPDLGGIDEPETLITIRRLEHAARFMRAQERAITELHAALEFYASPDTWYAVLLFADPPCGEIANDYSMIEEEGCERPGARARAALEASNGQ